jgi:transcriptional regulator with XRE-family HTH domain
MCDALRMTSLTPDTSPRVPTWDLADRMRKSLREADLGVQEMADYLDVARGTVGTWINGRITPSKQTLRLWALRCGVPLEWLEHGIVAHDLEPDGPDTLGGQSSRWKIAEFRPRTGPTCPDALRPAAAAA